MTYNRNNQLVSEIEIEKGETKFYSVRLLGKILEIDNVNKKLKSYYKNGKLEFEGEYINDRRNGKGKEYYETGKLRFDGEYLNNTKWNGKEYDKNGNIIYELNNGNGNVKKYDNKGNLKFEGEYTNGKRQGKGKEYNNNKLTFEGEYINDKRHGKGKEYDNDG